MLDAGPWPCFWRAPTDNDEGGALGSYAEAWRTSGLNELRVVVRAPAASGGGAAAATARTYGLPDCPDVWCSVAQGAPKIAPVKAPGGQGACFTAAWGLAPFGFAGAGSPSISVRLECSLSGDGEITVRHTPRKSYTAPPWKSRDVYAVSEANRSHMLPPAQVLYSLDVDKRFPPLPRVGVHMRLPPAMASVEWLGLGPHECYPDRKVSRARPSALSATGAWVLSSRILGGEGLSHFAVRTVRRRAPPSAATPRMSATCTPRISTRGRTAGGAPPGCARPRVRAPGACAAASATRRRPAAGPT